MAGHVGSEQEQTSVITSRCTQTAKNQGIWKKASGKARDCYSYWGKDYISFAKSKFNLTAYYVLSI